MGCNFLLEADFLFSDHFPDVDQRVAHSSECRIDAHSREIGNFFKAEIGIMSQDNHFTLLRWQLIDQMAHALVGLTPNNGGFCVVVGTTDHVKNMNFITMCGLL